MQKALLGCAVATFAASLSAQLPCFDFDLGTDLHMADDDLVQGLPLGFTFTYNGVGYTHICLDSNGSIYLGAATGEFSDFFPDVTFFLQSTTPRICGLWTDFEADAPGSGHIFYNAVPASGSVPAHALITWNGVYEYQQTTPITVQVRLDATGTVQVTYGAQGAIGGAVNTDVLVGATPGNNATANPVSFATRPVVINQNNFAEVTPVSGATPAGYSMIWVPTSPGYVAADTGCTPNVLPPAGTTTVLGAGCPSAQGATVYELFTATNPVDVSGTNFTFLPNGSGGYFVVPGIAGPFFTGLINNVAAADDSTHAVNLPFLFPHALSVANSIVVSSNGFLTLGSVDPGSGCCNGDPVDLVNNQPRIAAWWSDLNPAVAGGVYADLDPATGNFVVTWSQVPEYFSTGSNTFQIVLMPSGAFEIHLQTLGTSATHDFLLGYSYGNGTSDPGSTDFSAITTLDTGGIQAPLQHDAIGRPQLGTTFSPFCTGISPTPAGVLAVMFLEFTELPGIDLGFLGAPGCSAFLVPSGTGFSFFNVTAGAPFTTFPIAIPASTSFQSLQVISQCASDDPAANSFGWKVSNGLRWTLGI